jgi:hypothetical protein
VATHGNRFAAHGKEGVNSSTADLQSTCTPSEPQLRNEPRRQIHRAGGAFVHRLRERFASALRLPRTAPRDGFDLIALRARCRATLRYRGHTCKREPLHYGHAILAATVTGAGGSEIDPLVPVEVDALYRSDHFRPPSATTSPSSASRRNPCRPSWLADTVSWRRLAPDLLSEETARVRTDVRTGLSPQGALRCSLLQRRIASFAAGFRLLQLVAASRAGLLILEAQVRVLPGP